MGKTTVNPPDNSWMTQVAQQNNLAMQNQSNNSYMLGMAQIGQQIMQSQAMFSLGQAQIDSTMQLGRERLQNSLEIARMNYQAQVDKSEDKFEVDMAELDLRRYAIDKQAEAAANGNDLDMTDFYA